MNRKKKNHFLAVGVAAGLLSMAVSVSVYADATITGAPGGGALSAPAIYVPTADGSKGSSGQTVSQNSQQKLSSSQFGPGIGAAAQSAQGNSDSASQKQVEGTQTESEVSAPAYSGWKQTNGGWVWYQEDGTLLVNGWTPDGYFVDDGGSWKSETRNILDDTFAVTDRFKTAEDLPSMGALLTDLNRLNKRVQTYMNGKRIFHAYNEYITYSKLEDKKETVYLSLNRDKEKNGWNIQVSCDLGTRNNNRNYATTVDYEVLYFFISQISHTPNQVIDAIYRSWQGDNAWGLSFIKEVPVGDSLISYGADNGAVGYMIRRRQ